MRPSVLIKFSAYFLFYYGLLIAPWPGWDSTYSGWYRSICAGVFSHLPGPAVIRFEKNKNPQRENLSTQITFGNRSIVDRKGFSPAIVLQVDTRGVAWTPTALLLGLVLASPFSPRDKLAIGWKAILAIHIYILLITAFWLVNRSSDISLLRMTGMTKHFTQMLEYTFIDQIGASFVIPAVIWVMLSFRVARAQK